MRYQPFIVKPTSRLILTVALLAVCGCTRRAPAPVPAAEEAPAGESPQSLSIPLDVQEFEVVQADGRRGVFLKLSRLPEGVEHHSESRPARIVIDIKGPTGGESAEESFPGEDSLVSRMRVTRTFGVLKVVLDLQGNRPPRYSVHTMADWIMIRIGADESSGIEPWPVPFAVSACPLATSPLPRGLSINRSRGPCGRSGHSARRAQGPATTAPLHVARRSRTRESTVPAGSGSG